MEIKNGLIFVTANNTGKLHIFDFSQELLQKLAGVGWSEHRNGYLVGRVNKKRTYAHHLVLPPKEGYEIDHINRCKWDNRYSNLRYVTHSENLINRNPNSNNISGYVGISWNSRDRRWLAQIQKNGKAIHLGSFVNLEDAIAARKAAEEKYYPGIKLVI